MAKVVSLKGVLEEIGGYVLPFTGSLSVDESLPSTAYEVATGTTDGAISLGPITTASCVAITSDYAISYKLNGADTGITITAGGTHILHGTSVTAMTVTNASGSTATLKLFFWGT